MGSKKTRWLAVMGGIYVLKDGCMSGGGIWFENAFWASGNAIINLLSILRFTEASIFAWGWSVWAQIWQSFRKVLSLTQEFEEDCTSREQQLDFWTIFSTEWHDFDTSWWPDKQNSQGGEENTKTELVTTHIVNKNRNIFFILLYIIS